MRSNHGDGECDYTADVLTTALLVVRHVTLDKISRDWDEHDHVIQVFYIFVSHVTTDGRYCVSSIYNYPE